MPTPQEATPTPLERLEGIRQGFQALATKETSLRTARNTAVRDAVSRGVPVTHLARDVGLSRELLHRILRTTQAHHAATTSSGEDALAKLTEAQKSLDFVVAERTAQERRRAAAIRMIAGTALASRTEIAHFAGVSSETVRKICLAEQPTFKGSGPTGLCISSERLPVPNAPR